MSDIAKKARAAMKAKAQRLGSDRPLEKVDSSTWTPSELLNADAKTGMRPVSRRQFKKGGKVVGEAAPVRADRKPRKSGGKAITADSLINRNQKEANEERVGVKHVGGMKKGGRAAHATKGAVRDYSVTGKNTVTERPTPMPPRRPADLPGRDVEPSDLYDADQIARAERGYKKGGRAKKMAGGPMAGAEKMMQRAQAVGNVPGATMNFGKAERGALSPLRATGMKKGGEAHEDVAADKALIKKMVKPSARTGKMGGGLTSLLGGVGAGAIADSMKDDDKDGKKRGGRTGHAKGGSTYGVASKMRLLKTHTEGDNSAKVYKNPDTGEHQVKFFKDGIHQKKADYFADDPSDAHETAQESLKRGFNGGGRTGRATGGQVFSGPGYPGKVSGVVAGGRTAHAAGGKTKGKGKTAINIVINAGKADDGSVMPPGPMGAPKGLPIPVPPPGAGMPPGAAPPMPMPPPGMMGAGGPPGAPPMPPGGMPPMGRKAGGRTYRSYKDMDAGAGSGMGRLEKTEIEEHKRGERKAGGRTYRSYKDMDAGSGSGLGRLEKTEIAARKGGIQRA